MFENLKTANENIGSGRSIHRWKDSIKVSLPVPAMLIIPCFLWIPKFYCPLGLYFNRLLGILLLSFCYMCSMHFCSWTCIFQFTHYICNLFLISSLQILTQLCTETWGSQFICCWCPYILWNNFHCCKSVWMTIIS